MCEKCPRLRGHLANEYDDVLISKVLSHIVPPDPGTLRQWQHQMAEAVSQTQATHTYSIREEILTYLEPFDYPSLGIAVPVKLPKDLRGLENVATARFLISRRHLDEFEGAPHEYALSSSITLYADIHLPSLPEQLQSSWMGT